LDAPVLVALASVLVALVYNGVQARDSAEQLQQGRDNLARSARADEFTTFMEMHDRIVRTDTETNESIVAYLEACGPEADPCFSRRGQLAALKMVRDITPFEGVVHALERGVLPAETGKVWTSYLVCDHRAVARLTAGTLGRGLASYVPRLASFARNHPVPKEVCLLGS
jgi:hypothetical protein